MGAKGEGRGGEGVQRRALGRAQRRGGGFCRGGAAEKERPVDSPPSDPCARRNTLPSSGRPRR